MPPIDERATAPSFGGVLRSMTGYGRGEAAADGIAAVAEISSLNRRQMDIRLHLPRGLAIRETTFIERVQRRLSRGQVSATVTVDATASGASAEPVQLPRRQAEVWITALRTIANDLKLSDDLGASHLLQLPGMLPSPSADAGLPPQAESLALCAFDAALDALCAMREQEGLRLRQDLALRLVRLQAYLDAIARRAPDVVIAWRNLLQRRLADAGQTVALEDETFRRELLVFATRADITEEITRLRSHFEQAEGFMQSAEPVGRALDFLAQEMAREINTLGAKAADAEISGQVVGFKTELDRFREQIQNVE